MSYAGAPAQDVRPTLVRIVSAIQHADYAGDRAALALVPYWHYVGDILMVQIQQAKHARR